MCPLLIFCSEVTSFLMAWWNCAFWRVTRCMNQHFIQTLFIDGVALIAHTWLLLVSDVDTGRCTHGCVRLTKLLLAGLMLVLLCAASEPRACRALQELCNAALSSVLGRRHLWCIFNQKNSPLVAVNLLQESQVIESFSGIPFWGQLPSGANVLVYKQRYK